MPSIEQTLSGLRAAAEPSRLRLIALCADGDLTVSELTHILGQSQPRVSRHLKLLCEAGILERYQERNWAFYRLSSDPLARAVVELLPNGDPTLVLDRERLGAVKHERERRAARFFRDNAARWDEVRALYTSDREVEAALRGLIGDRKIDALLDIGTGTGRILQLLAPYFGRGVGIDRSSDMLAVARVNLEQAGLRNCQVRHGDMYSLPYASGAFDAVVIHMVLHYVDNPQAAVAEAARVLSPGGRLVVVDFAPHEVDGLRESHAHRRLGFAAEEVDGWLTAAGLETGQPARLAGDPITVLLWPATRMNVTPLPAARRHAHRGGQ